MSVKTKDEILSSIKALLGDEPSDEGIALLEDISDTLDKSTDGSADENKKKIEELEKQVKDVDAMWRKKYSDRFLNPSPEDKTNDEQETEQETEQEEDNSPKKFDDLFSGSNS